MTQNTFEITNENFKEEVLGSEVPVLVDFWAEWCGPCRMLGPIIEEIADELDGKVLVGKLNVDENIELATAYGVSSIPTVIFFKGGQEDNRVVGLRTKEDIIKAIEL